MGQLKRLLYYLLINVVVSACTILAVLMIWERVNAPKLPVSADLSRATPASMSAGEPGTQSSAGIPLAPAPTTTPQPSPVQDVVEYRVRPNDTLGQIAQEYETSLETLMEFNSLTDANSISVGQIIYIPVTPEFVPTQTPAASPTRSALTSGTPSGPVPEARVIINSVIGAGDLASERVFLTRTGSGVLSLAGWRLLDENGNVFVFPQLELFAPGGVHVWTTSGSTTVVDLYWGLNSPVWGPGEKVTLLDGEGKERATYIVP